MAGPLLRLAQRGGAAPDTDRFILYWGSRSPGTIGSDSRYRWELLAERTKGQPWCPPRGQWRAWRPRDQQLLEREPDVVEKRVVVPIAIAEQCALLDALAEGDDPAAEEARRLLDESEPIFRTDLASYVRASHAWTDTFALFCLCRQPAALERLQPFAIAIAACYAPAAKRDGGKVLGARFPFHGRPLTSASAYLASGLLALGSDLSLVASLSEFVASSQRDSGGFGDDDEPDDVMTTLAAADLLAHVDPAFDPEPAAVALESFQTEEGWFRALGPEAPWLTDAVVSWLDATSLPFAARFRWPHLLRANRDKKTGLPFYAYFTDLARLFGELPGIAASRCPLAFLDLVGFREFNNAFGQDMGDAVLAAFAEELGTLPECTVIRDGGDEFLVVGAPTGTALGDAVEALRRRWPGSFERRFGRDAPPVASRVLVAHAAGRDLLAAREHLGRAVGELKHVDVDARLGIQRDLGPL
jgi:GGDEF domain-containing protein